MNEEKPKFNKFLVVFAITAVAAISTPSLLMIVFKDDVGFSFQNPSAEDSVYWISGTIVVWAIFGLIAAYNIFNFLKKNITTKSKIQALILMPLLVFTTIGGVFYIKMETIPEVRGPYLSWMADPTTTMTVSFELKEERNFQIEYKKVTDTNWTPKIDITRLPKRDYDGFYHYIVNLTGLEPNTRYNYRIGGVTSEVLDFRTAPLEKNASFKFILYGDSREYSKTIDNQHIPLVQQILSEQNLEDILFIANTGDTASSHDDIDSWNLHFYAIKDLASHVPYFVASGNHEWDTSQPWYDTLHQPAIDIQDFPIGNDVAHDVYSLNETSYAFGLGSTYFIFLGYPHAGSNKTEYLNWVEQQLKIANGTIGSGYNFTFIFNHRPPFDRRETSYNDASDIIKTELPMEYYSGVDAFISGHNHVLAIQNITWSGDLAYPNSRNMTFLITGGGGASLRVPKYGLWENNYSMGFYGRTIYCKKTYHYYVVEVNPLQGIARFNCYELESGYLPEGSFTINI
ncbi:MAG: purple acid phosphatase family protein [Promethearchaeota archaeon]